jgi:hypothetical protein
MLVYCRTSLVIARAEGCFQQAGHSEIARMWLLDLDNLELSAGHIAAASVLPQAVKKLAIRDTMDIAFADKSVRVVFKRMQNIRDLAAED